MKTHLYPNFRGRRPSCSLREKGFALIISITLMMLLVALSVGLLGLSAKSISISKQSSEFAEARANARLALSLAIAQLQKETGPDQRITVTADQLGSDADGGQSASAPDRRHWTGVYRSWDLTDEYRPEPEFLSWLVSGDRNAISNPDTAKSPAVGTGSVELVGEGTVGSATDGIIKVPAVDLSTDASTTRTGRFAYWVGDQGVKAALSTPQPTEDPSPAFVRAGMQTAPRSAVQLAGKGAAKPFADLAGNDPRLASVVSWNQSSFVASTPGTSRGLFHDLAPVSSGLLTNVRGGGFRKDLSMALETAVSSPPKNPLYSVGSGANRENGINFLELWGYYNLYKEVRTSGNARFTTGGTLSRSANFLQVDPNPAACARDDEFYYKQPVIINYQIVFSFETRPVTVGGNIVYRLHVVADPILTLWNPLDVPVVVPRTAFFSVKYWPLPYDINISINNGPVRRCPLVASLSPGDSNYLSIRIGEQEQLVFKPGEVIKLSQPANTIVRGSNVTDHNLVGRSGFNFGGGVSLPMRDQALTYIDLRPTDAITYEATPNNLTAGRGSSGNVLPGYNGHTRHFSLSHHEYYIGADRGEANNSLGIGGIYLDWDFGNRRLKPGEVRQTNQAGTKPSNQRLRANRPNLADVFRPILKSDGRPLNAADINGLKSPFVLVSYAAKTEAGSTRGTRSLARFNPKALHVDFFDLTPEERDMLPYEYTVEPLVSWKNNKLETSSNGNAFWGGGWDAQLGTTRVITHSVPREPLWSLGSLQHSFANGFEMLRPVPGYAALNAREPMMPQISHAIGNSTAPPIMAPESTTSTLAGGRPAADHSYLANRALWDDWFFSGIAPQTRTSFGTQRAAQKAVAEGFLKQERDLPVARYRADTRGVDIDKHLTSLFRGSFPSADAPNLTASLIRVDGLFNVNSTSVEAWKAVLGATHNRPLMVSDENGAETLEEADGLTPVAGLIGPNNLLTTSSDNPGLNDPASWTGRRALTDEDIDLLARAIVREVRKRGPFLSLSDFVNRRPGPNRDHARAGAIQSALDSPDVPLNSKFLAGGRGVSSAVASRFAFPEAEEGPISKGIPGIIKQADILTPIAPIISVRSDSFIIRTYGESVGKDGQVRARAWCEAVVERRKEFVDSADDPETAITSLKSSANQRFGRRYEVVSFRWLHPGEI